MSTPHSNGSTPRVIGFASITWPRELPTLLEQAAKQERSYSGFLEEVLSREVQAKGAKHLAIRLAMARFPFEKTLESFDFKVLALNRSQSVPRTRDGPLPRAWGKCVGTGRPGLGKMHLAVG